MVDQQLVEISLTLDDELVEPVAEALARYVKGGVAIESTTVTATMHDAAGRAVGPWRVYGYLVVDETLEDKRRRLEEALWFIGRIRPLPEAQYRTIAESDWSEAWKQHYHPIPVGQRLMIVPAWLELPQVDRLAVRIDPGMAFGTGTHPTTQLCLELVEKFFMRQAGSTQTVDVIDIGCGTAILAIAALKLGARRALGVDIDADAVRAACQNAQANQVEEQIEFGQGSLQEILNGAYSLQKGQLVLANILAPVCIDLLETGLGRLLSESGELVLSGILAEQAAAVETAARSVGLQLIETLQDGDWVALRFGSNRD